MIEKQSSFSHAIYFCHFHHREVGTITYRSGPEWELRFNRKRRSPDDIPSFCPDFEIEHYLDRQVQYKHMESFYFYLILFVDRVKSFVKVILIPILGCTFLK